MANQKKIKTTNKDDIKLLLKYVTDFADSNVASSSYLYSQDEDQKMTDDIDRLTKKHLK